MNCCFSGHAASSVSMNELGSGQFRYSDDFSVCFFLILGHSLFVRVRSEVLVAGRRLLRSGKLEVDVVSSFEIRIFLDECRFQEQSFSFPGRPAPVFSQFGHPDRFISPNISMQFQALPKFQFGAKFRATTQPRESFHQPK